MQLERTGTKAGMIIDDIGIHHGDRPLISINGDQDIKNSNWRDKNYMDGLRMRCGMWDVDLDRFVGIAFSGIVYLLY